MAKRNRQNAPANPEPATPETPETDPLAGLSDEGHNEFVDQLLTQAQGLQDEKHDLYERIAANRDLARNVQKTGLLSEKQAKAVDLFYPVRVTKKDENGQAPAEQPAAAAA